MIRTTDVFLFLLVFSSSIFIFCRNVMLLVSKMNGHLVARRRTQVSFIWWLFSTRYIYIYDIQLHQSNLYSETSTTRDYVYNFIYFLSLHILSTRTVSRKNIQLLHELSTLRYRYRVLGVCQSLRESIDSYYRQWERMHDVCTYVYNCAKIINAPLMQL